MAVTASPFSATRFIGSFIALMRIDPGFNPERVLAVQISPRWEPGSPPPDSGPAFGRIVDRISQAHGVVHASMISGGMPLGGGMSVTTMSVPGRKIEPGKDKGLGIRRVTTDYHKALRIPLLSGRYFETSDRKGAASVAILNESAAKKYFPGENPIGRTVHINDQRAVVGVVGDVYQSSLETEPRTAACSSDGTVADRSSAFVAIECRRSILE